MMHLNLYNSRSVGVENAYIITIKGNKTSEQLSERCQESCKAVGMSFVKWDAFDATRGGIESPPHLVREMFFRTLKITDHYLTRGEVACALSHISLWYHCMVIDKPIVILEHDAVVVKKFEHHDVLNSIIYLGGNEWAKRGWHIDPIPPLASDGPNHLFICRAHAYSIDPAVARNLVAHVLRMGICAPLDIMMRSDLFCITHRGLYAYDDPANQTTIQNRSKTGRTTHRNDDLRL